MTHGIPPDYSERKCDFCMKSEADLYRGEARLIVTLMDGLRWCVECLWDKESNG